MNIKSVFAAVVLSVVSAVTPAQAKEYPTAYMYCRQVSKVDWSGEESKLISQTKSHTNIKVYGDYDYFEVYRRGGLLFRSAEMTHETTGGERYTVTTEDYTYQIANAKSDEFYVIRHDLKTGIAEIYEECI